MLPALFHFVSLFMFLSFSLFHLGPVQTSNFTCAESNANEKNLLFSLICIRFGTCKVRRLNRALEGYRIRLNDPPVSGIPSCLRVNTVLRSESFKLFSVLSRRMLHNLICLSLLLAKYFLSRQALSFLWLLKIQYAGLTRRFQVSIVSCLFLIVCLFLYLPLICFRLCLHRSAFACS